MHEQLKFLTAKEVAEAFFHNDLNYQKVLRLTRNGILPAKKFGKSYLYEKSELEFWVSNNFSTPAYFKIII